MKQLKEEFIGEKVQITKSTNKTLVGLKGTIIDETKNTFKIKTNKKTVVALKNTSTFIIKNQEIQGEKITKKPQDRIKIK